MIPFQIPDLPICPIPSAASPVESGAEFAAVFAELVREVVQVEEPEPIPEAAVEVDVEKLEEGAVEEAEVPDAPVAEVPQANREPTPTPDSEQSQLLTEIPARPCSDEPPAETAEPAKVPIPREDAEAPGDAPPTIEPLMPDRVAPPQIPEANTPVATQSVDRSKVHDDVPQPVKKTAQVETAPAERPTAALAPVHVESGTQMPEQQTDCPEPAAPESSEDPSADTPLAVPRERDAPQTPSLPLPAPQPTRASEPPAQRTEVPAAPDIAPLRAATPDEPGVVIASETADVIEVDIPQGKDAPVKLRIETADDSAIVTVTTERQMIEPVQRALPVLSDEMVRSGFASLSVNIEARGERQKRQQRATEHHHDDAPQERPRITTGIDIRI
ncbi:hypothetical protein HCZ30_12725 [Marivivens donghaensis]|uniref:Flagellar hook-length control protein-like C-terminal domain-containing protein n=1 Tax=Marivivens donghaensis TaxID=1699413 RepID=A0ABX0W1A3_9RHOB|nr:hypothetical protein [Marivivens donghaensis]NIY73291.1 hypothetical protein [Marivivens donghaensis]